MRARAGFRMARAAVAVVAAVLVLGVSGAVAYRVLAPAEVLTPARTGYAAPLGEPPKVLGTLTAAPLIVDGRLRVYATTRQVRAEQPVDARTRRTPFWSFRRWPEQLVGVVAIGATVVSRWSDGELVALDAATGRISWRAAGPAADQEYAGRGTGASTLYDPPGLHSATAADGRAVLVVVGAAGRRGYDPATGRELWRDGSAGRCRGDAFTTTTGQLVTVDRCAGPETVEFHDVATGARTGRWRPEGAGAALVVRPVGCRPGRSACPAMRTGGHPNPPAAGSSAANPPDANSPGVGSTGADPHDVDRPGADSRGWLFAAGGSAGPNRSAPAPVPAPALDHPDAILVDGTAVAPDGSGLVGRVARTGAEAWRWTGDGPVRPLAGQPGRVHLRTGSGDLVTLDPADGRERSRFPLTYGRDSTKWSPGYAYAADGYLAVERLAEPVDPDADDHRYYLSIQPVIFAAT